MKKLILALTLVLFPLVAAAQSQGTPSFQSVSTLNSVDVTNPRFGAKCNDTTDDTTAINAAISYINSVGGGTVFIPGKCLMNGAMVIPYTGTTNPAQNPIRIAGFNENWDSYIGNSTYGLAAPLGGAALDMRYAGGDGTHVAKIDTRGSGILEIDHLTIMDGGTDNYQFLQTTNTTLSIHDDHFIGNPTCSRTTCSQNVLLLGGNTSASTTLGTNAATAGFQGYGTRIYNNSFSHIAIAIEFGGAANGIYAENNIVDATSGSANTTTGAPFQFDGWTSGNTIAGGFVEMQGYAYAVASIALVGTEGNGNNFFDNIGLYDETMGSPTLGGYYFAGGLGEQDIVYDGYADGSLNAALLGGAGWPAVTLISNGTTSIFAQPTTFRSSITANGTLAVNGSNIVWGKHLAPNGPAPTTSNGTLSSTSTDNSGTLTEGSSSTGATITFNAAWAAAPVCSVSSPTGSTFTSYSTTTTTLTITNASASGDQFSYNCQQ